MSFFQVKYLNRKLIDPMSVFFSGGLELLDGPKPGDILVGPRVGIDYALQEHVNALWRFAIAGTPWISAPKSTLRPP